MCHLSALACGGRYHMNCSLVRIVAILIIHILWEEKHHAPTLMNPRCGVYVVQPVRSPGHWVSRRSPCRPRTAMVPTRARESVLPISYRVHSQLPTCFFPHHYAWGVVVSNGPGTFSWGFGVLLSRYPTNHTLYTSRVPFLDSHSPVV